MFYDGDLQSGIFVALRESKHVVCFVRGDDDQSRQWEDEYLKDDQIVNALTQRAVSLRINEGSQEASYLSAYYPVPVTPSLLVILNGQLLLDLRAPATKNQFKAQLLKNMISINSSASPSSGLAITPLQPTQSIPNEATPPNSTPAFDRSTFSGTREHVTASPIQNTSTTSGPVDSGATTEVSSTILTSQPPSPTSPPSDQSNPPSNEPSQAIQNLLAERRRRLETDKKEKEAAEKAERKAKAEARKESVLLDPNSAKAKQAIHAQQQRRKQQEAKSERERVLRQIESDKAERKQREEQRKTLAKADAEGKDASLVEQQLRSEMNGPKTTISNECAIQIRTFDGSTIRGKFPSGCTVRTDVRTWLDAQRGNGGLPYTLKQILIPLPNRALSISDEEETLQSLGLTPNATLVMVPIQAYTAAYKRSPGIVSRGASAGYNVVSAGAGMITGALGPFLGLITDQRTPTQADIPPNITTQSSPETEVRGSGSGLNVRTLRDQRDHEDQQLYNGNQLNFEPRRDTDDRKD